MILAEFLLYMILLQIFFLNARETTSYYNYIWVIIKNSYFALVFIIFIPTISDKIRGPIGRKR